MEEITTVYVVQYWDDRYEFWTTCSEPTGSMFVIPTSHYDTAAEAQARYGVLAAANPSSKYRVAKVTTTVEEIF